MPASIRDAALLTHGRSLSRRPSSPGGQTNNEIPIHNEEQRRALDEAKRFAGRGSLIPDDKRYVEQLRRFE